MQLKKYKILQAPCFLVEDIDILKQYIINLINNKQGGYSVAINAEKIIMYSKSDNIKNIIDNSILPIPDGAGAVLGFKLLYNKKCLKVDLPKLILEISNENKYNVFLLGSHEKINKLASEKIRQTYPNINIVGRQNGYFDTKEKIINILRKTKPNVVLLALGSPKQEILAYELKDKFPNILFVGCGGALDIISGYKKRAPKIFRDYYLEWLYRLLKEPRRIKRQKVLPIFFFKLVYESFKRRFYK